jgi:CheY-like chemotaxis protein/nitrogen-specific signal transduction histidine kinase
MKQASDFSARKEQYMSPMSHSPKNKGRNDSVNDELSVDQTKLQFLANMNHELRTPLTGLMGAAELLGMTCLSEEQKHYLQIFRNSSEQLLSIVNDVLDYSKMATGQLSLNYSNFDLRSLLQESFLHFEPFAQRKGLTLRYNIHPSVPRLYYGDQQRLSQLLSHLVSNAIKFTAQGLIEIDAQQCEEALTLNVRDSGIGISSEQLPHIFDSFYQADTSHSRSYGGTGLGLAICKYLAILMDGEITAISALRKGSSFRVRLPPMRKPSELALHPLRKMQGTKVLLVEDNEINQAIILLLFNKKGIQIDIAADGQEGLNLHRKNRYDLIFMDMQMPVMDGIQATREIRSFDPHVFIVALTSDMHPDSEKECLQIGMNDCFAKPLDQNRLESLLGMIACH